MRIFFTLDKIRTNTLFSFFCERASVCQPARTYLHQLCADTGWGLEDLVRARDGWRERERERETVCVGSLCWQCNSIITMKILSHYEIINFSSSASEGHSEQAKKIGEPWTTWSYLDQELSLILANHLKSPLAHSARVVEYTDYISAKGQDSLNECHGYDT